MSWNQRLSGKLEQDVVSSKQEVSGRSQRQKEVRVTAENRCWMTVARASTRRFPCSSSLLSWTAAWFFLSSLFCFSAAPPAPGLEPF